jgi:acetyl/propionyl-CoA carboxylase alpha subunit
MTKLEFDSTSQQYSLELVSLGKSYRATVADKTVDVEILSAHTEHGKLELLIDGQRVVAYVSMDGAKRWVTVNGQTVVLTKSTGAKRKSTGHDQASGLAAPMPGLVRSVNVEEGESVSKGQTLLVLEAMKMEIRIHAPREGMIRKLMVQQGQTVEREQMLIEIE